MHNRLKIYLILLPFFMLILGSSTSLFSYTTENVVIVFMGGIRNSEVFEDTTHTYTPRIWDNIVPEGTLYRDFYNMAFTGMGTGTHIAMMGVRRNENHRGTSWHGMSPGMFEYYRMDRSVPQEDVWAVLSNDFDGMGISYGFHPAYGQQYAGSIWGNSRNIDIETFEKVMQVMDDYHPSLLTVHFRDPDRRAQHVHDPDMPDSVAWVNYCRAVAVVDSLAYLIWDRINTDPHYAGKTALFLTCAHGRHSPLYGDFEWHGNACEGCRRLPFLAFGPDFKSGEIIEERGDLIDLCPTVGELLSFDPVFAEGRILDELFLEPPRGSPGDVRTSGARHDGSPSSEYVRISRSEAFSRNPYVQVVDGVLHVIWTERDTAALLEAWNVMHSKSIDGGVSWSEPQPLFLTVDSSREVITGASVSGDGASVGVVTTSYGWDQYWQGDSAWVWKSDFKTTVDGSEWQEKTNAYLKNGGMITTDDLPTVHVKDSLCATVFLADRFNRFCSVSFDLGNNWFNFKEEYEPDAEFASPNTPSIVIGDILYYAESMRFVAKSDLYLFTANGDSADLVFRSPIDDTNDESFFPKISYSDSALYCVWSDDRDGHWEIYFSKSTDGGFTWTPNERVSDSGVGTWQTSMLVRGDTLLVVWEDYRNGTCSLYKKVSTDGGDSWTDEIAEVVTPGISTSPQLSYGEGRYYLVWQDRSSGKWEVYFKEVDLDIPSGVEGEEEGGAPVPGNFELFQNYPNPFNPQTEISFDVPGSRAVDVDLRIYDVRGKLVRIFAEGLFEPGRHRVMWDGKDRSGRPVASGIYFYTLQVPEKTLIRKMLLAR